MSQMPPGFPPPPDQRGAWAGGQQPAGMGPSSWVGYPLSIGRVIQLTFSLFGFRPLQFIAVGIVLMAPVSMVIALLQLAIAPDLLAVQQAQIDVTLGRQIDLTTLVPIRAVLVNLVSVVAIALAAYLTQGALARMVADSFAGRQPNARAALRAALGRTVSLLGAGVLIQLLTFGIVLVGITVAVLLFIASSAGGQLQPGLAVFIGLILVVATVVVLVFLALRWSFVPQAVVVERHAAMPALGRSWRLISGATWRVLGYVIFFAVLVGAFVLLVDIVLGLLLGSGFRLVGTTVVFEPVPFLVTSAIHALLNGALAPIGAIALTILYFDLRFRRGEIPPGSAVPPDLAAEQQAQPGVQR